MDDDDRMRCICCNRKQEVLISVIAPKDSIFMYSRGVCQVCIKDKDINNICEEYEIRKTKENIEELEESLKTMKEQLTKFDANSEDRE